MRIAKKHKRRQGREAPRRQFGDISLVPASCTLQNHTDLLIYGQNEVATPNITVRGVAVKWKVRREWHRPHAGWTSFTVNDSNGIREIPKLCKFTHTS
jgi:hypothetical protein